MLAIAALFALIIVVGTCAVMINDALEDVAERSRVRRNGGRDLTAGRRIRP